VKKRTKIYKNVRRYDDEARFPVVWLAKKHFNDGFLPFRGSNRFNGFQTEITRQVSMQFVENFRLFAFDFCEHLLDLVFSYDRKGIII
jgi:hypothetical protein